ncbi:MAG: polysaccharide biosynthesis C-terminal domain-containing protein [Bacteroidia bacterium]
MGIVKRQGIKSTIIQMIGVLIGVVNLMYIYPLVYEKSQIGIFRFLIEVGSTAAPFALLGLHTAVVRFFPDFKTEGSNHHNGFLSFFLMASSIFILFFCFVYFLFGNEILNMLGKRDPLFNNYLGLVLPLTIVISYHVLLHQHAINQLRITVPAIISLFIKIAIPALGVLYYKEFITFDWVMNGIVITYGIMMLSTLLYLYSIGGANLRPKFSFITKKRIKKISEFSLFGILGSLGSILATRIDVIMVASLTTLDNTGIYVIAMFVANVLAMPTTAIQNITGPLIAEHHKKNELKEIEILYKKSSLNLMMAGLLLITLIWLSVDNLFDFMPNGDGYRAGKYVILFLALAKLVDMTMSVNQRVIAYSKYFRFNLYAMLLMAVFNVITNLLLIPEFGINGAAIATFASLTLFNLVKFGYIWFRFKMQPLSWQTLGALAIAACAFVAGYISPELGHPVASIILRSIIITVVFGGLAFITKVSPDINGLVFTALEKLGLRK